MGAAYRGQPPIPNAAYGSSKAVVNWLGIRLHSEEEWLNTIVLGPGLVKTELGTAGAIGLGLDQDMIDKTMISVDESCDGMIKAIDTTSREAHGGKMLAYNGEVIEW